MQQSDHRLIGLEPDNLLAFLALLGVLRSLDHQGIRVRVSWSGQPLRPVLHFPQTVTQDALLEVVSSGCAELAKVHDFDRADLSFATADARAMLERAHSTPLAQDLWSALLSDGALKEGDEDAQAAPLCAMFGQGHQHFLQRLTDIPQGKLTKELAKQKKPPNLNASSYLAAALFATWNRSDPTESFRWDPAEDRRYALRFENPSTDKGLTVHGANRLAAIGFPLLTSVPARLRRIRLTPRGGHWDRKTGTFSFRWPIWQQSATLPAILALLNHPKLEQGSIAELSITTVFQADRISVGKFFNFTRARRVA